MMSDTDILTPQHRANKYIYSYVYIKYIEKYMNGIVDNNVDRIIELIGDPSFTIRAVGGVLWICPHLIRRRPEFYEQEFYDSFINRH